MEKLSTCQPPQKHLCLYCSTSAYNKGFTLRVGKASWAPKEEWLVRRRPHRMCHEAPLTKAAPLGNAGVGSRDSQPLEESCPPAESSLLCELKSHCDDFLKDAARKAAL